MDSDEQQSISKPGQLPVPASARRLATHQDHTAAIGSTPTRALVPGGRATGGLLLGGLALGGLAVGGLAFGALAIGRLAFGQLVPGRTRLPSNQFDQRRVARLIIAELRIEHLHDG